MIPKIPTQEREDSHASKSFVVVRAVFPWFTFGASTRQSGLFGG
jgi:hypothetical protein